MGCSAVSELITKPRRHLVRQSTTDKVRRGQLKSYAEALCRSCSQSSPVPHATPHRRK